MRHIILAETLDLAYGYARDNNLPGPNQVVVDSSGERHWSTFITPVTDPDINKHRSIKGEHKLHWVGAYRERMSEETASFVELLKLGV